ncbi:MAG: hypothetical protein PHG05_03800 [Candidatus Nanoarchaeia archaeon]|nr:hypothetical protein [Candidatus Nanoarchaeia archaeon]
MSNFEKDFKEIKRITNVFERLDRLKELLKTELEKEEEKKVLSEIEETDKEIFLSKSWEARTDNGINNIFNESFVVRGKEIPNLEKVVKEEDVIVENTGKEIKLDYTKPFGLNGFYNPENENKPKEKIDYSKPKEKIDYDKQKEVEEELIRYSKA